MSKHDPRVTLQQLRDAARDAASFCAGRTLEELTRDRVQVLALERCFEIMGEAIKRLPMELRARYPEQNWKQVAGLRDVVVHGYDSVDHGILWKAVAEDFPNLFSTIERMLSDLGGELPADESAR